MADQKHGVRVVAEIVFEPQRAFQIKIVGRLVEQEQIGLGEQHGSKRDAHPPAAGEAGCRALLRLLIETEAGKNGCSARFGGVRVDIGKPRLNLGNSMSVGRRFGFSHKRGTLGVSREHDIDQRLVGARRLLRHLADARVFGEIDLTLLRRQLAGDGAKQRRLAGAVAADKPGLGAGRQRQARLLYEETAGNAQGKVRYGQHGGRLMAEPERRRKGRCGKHRRFRCLTIHSHLAIDPNQ